MNTKAHEAERKLEEFSLNFGNEGFVETTIVKACEGIYTVAETVFGAEQADLGMAALLRPKLGDDVDEGWQDALHTQMMGLYSEVPIGEVFHNLEAYALHGVFPGYAEDETARAKKIQTCLNACQRFMDYIPFRAWQIENEYAVSIFDKAKARCKLDQGKALSLDELSCISGYAKQTIRNKMAGEFKELVGSAKSIRADQALAWLNTKKNFEPSLWQFQNDEGLGEIIQANQLKDPLFVPVASDGTVFSEDARKDGAFRVGNQNAELQVTDFDAALSILHTAASPAWLRPTKTGRWTQVRGAGWQRVVKNPKAPL